MFFPSQVTIRVNFWNVRVNWRAFIFCASFSVSKEKNLQKLCQTYTLLMIALVLLKKVVVLYLCKHHLEDFYFLGISQASMCWCGDYFTWESPPTSPRHVSPRSIQVNMQVEFPPHGSHGSMNWRPIGDSFNLHLLLPYLKYNIGTPMMQGSTLLALQTL